VNKMLRTSLCSAGVALLCVGLAAAQGPQAAISTRPVVLPPSPVYTNCGVGCTTWGGSAYYISGTAATVAPGQTLAVRFTWKGTASLTKVIEANLMFAGAGPIGAAILKDSNGVPGATLAKLTGPKSCPGTKNQPCTYKPRKALKVRAGTQLWLCQYALKPTDEGGWNESNSDKSRLNNFYLNLVGTCNAGANWVNVGAGVIRPAFEIN